MFGLLPQLGKCFGAVIAGDIPDAPVISGVADNGDQGGITVTVSGSNTIQLYYRLKYEAVWTIGESRSGGGNIIQTGLVADSWYDLYATTIDGDAESPPSAIHTIKVLGSDDSIEAALKSLLAADDTIAGLVGARIYPNLIPQKAPMPAISYQQISGPRGQVMAGPDGTVKARYQINCKSDTYSVAKDVSEAVRKRLDGYRGTVNTKAIQSVQLANEGDLPDLSAGIDILRRYGKRLDFTVFYKE